MTETTPVTTTETPVTKKAPTPRKKAEKKDKPKSELRAPQIRILKALKGGKTLTRAQIASKAPVDVATCVEYLGSPDPAIREKNDKKHFPSLVSLGLVRQEQHDIDNRDVMMYSITAKGTKALEKA